MTQLGGLDTLMMDYEDLGLSQNMTGVYIYDPSTAPGKTIGYEDLVAFLNARLKELPVFRRRLHRLPLHLDKPYWLEDPDFDIERHVRRLALPGKKDLHELRRLITHLHTLPLDQSKPLWEFYFIEGLDRVEGYAPGCFALVQKWHHSSSDGASAIRMVALMHDLSAEFEHAHRERAQFAPARPHAIKVWGNALRSHVEMPMRLVGFLRNAVSLAWARVKSKSMTERFADMSMPKVPMTRFQQRIGTERVIGGIRLDLPDLKTIRSAVANATINDVLLAGLGGGLRRYLLDKKELPRSSLVCSCPVDIRTEEDRSTEGNVVGLMQVSLHTDLTKPLERLAAVQADSVRAKALSASGEGRIMTQLLDSLSGPLIATVARSAFSDAMSGRAFLGNTMLSNVPGPTRQLYLRGAKMVGYIGVPPLLPGGEGLPHVAFSYVFDGKPVFTLDFVSTPEMLPDPRFYERCLRESFDELKSAARLALPSAGGPTKNKRATARQSHPRASKVRRAAR